jgi:O-antigen/teichoic acid export membrane protein
MKRSPPNSEGSSESEIRSDARDLRRGVAVNIGGYILKVAYSAFVFVAVLLYGKQGFGIFTVAQAGILITARACMMGLNKAVLWWVPRQDPERERTGLVPALLGVGGLCTVAALAVGTFLAPLIANWSGEPEAAVGIRWMAAGLVPFALTEVLVSACLGKRRMEVRVIVREAVVSVGLLVGAVGFHLAGLDTVGLPLAFVVANSAGLLAAVIAFRKVFAGSRWPAREYWPPRAMVRYALPMWGSELLSSIVQRMDVLVIGALTDAATVGIYGAVFQVGNVLRSVRSAFDPIVLAIVSQIGSRHDPKRLTAGISHATVLAVATQLPIYAFLLAFTPWIMPLLGEGFEAATPSVLILAGFFLISGVIGLKGHIVTGYGRSDLALVNVLATIAVEALLLWLLVPTYRLEGAAIAAGGGAVFRNLLQVIEARAITGGWSYDRTVVWILLLGLVSSAVMALAWFGLAPLGDTGQRIGAFAAFLAAAGLGLAILVRGGRLSLRGSGRSG